jgi:hypothetical protein
MGCLRWHAATIEFPDQSAIRVGPADEMVGRQTDRHTTHVQHRHPFVGILVQNSDADTRLKNGVFWDVTLCGSCKNRRFGGT